MAGFYEIRTVTWEDDSVNMIDQTLLPGKLERVRFTRPEEVANAIRTMVVRGAPAIGVAAAMGVALAAVGSGERDVGKLMKELHRAAELLRSTRPTAVNLFWGIDRIMAVATSAHSADQLRAAVAKEAKEIEDEDVEVNMKLGRIGARLINDGETILTQCNAGALATVGYGTAIGVIRAAAREGKLVKVLVPETRPALQGARLTAFELLTDGIDCTVIPDTAVGYMISIGRVDKVIVGADRITRDGYVFNKIGTYQEAVLASRHGVPFYPAAPHSTFDLSHTHEQVKIEERPFQEVVSIRGRRIAPKGVSVANPAFDVTPPSLVTAIISDRGLVEEPLDKNIPLVIS